jgi:prepilin peptidase CpaA
MQHTLATELLMFNLLLLLVLATALDIQKHIIPNMLCLVILICGVTFHIILSGWEGLLTAISGLLVGFFIFVPFYIAGGMAAGDVKLMAATGAQLGPLTALLAAGLSLIAGCMLALLIVLFKGELLTLLQRYFQIVQTWLYTQEFIYEKPQPEHASALRFPYALAIAAGSLLALAHQSLLNFNHLRSLLDGGVL